MKKEREERLVVLVEHLLSELQASAMKGEQGDVLILF